ncbi:MAG: phosphatidylserine decarboxylase [Chlamydiae bacterium]|nr:phosphatidylserine decarboxylase [Chlamydiota bacterium]
MYHVFYVERSTKKVEEEPIYGHIFIEILYGSKWWMRLISKIFLPIFTQNAFFSKWYGKRQKRASSRKKIDKFIENYSICMEDFIVPEGGFASFNDFFIRKLKPGARPLVPGDKTLVLPADGRYFVLPEVQESSFFFVKGQGFSLKSLLHDEKLAKKYEGGVLVFARLCPTDYHRFHFPCRCLPGSAEAICGHLYSVNPIALRRYRHILWENKRVITRLETEYFGDMLYIEVGATAVGTICQTYEPDRWYDKGEEKGYFEFGGSSVILLFEKNKIVLEEDLVKASSQKLELKASMGESLGRSLL